MSTEAPVVEVPKGTVGFEHTVIAGEYGDGKSVASIFLPFDPTAEGALVATQVAAKEAVFQALGVEYEFDVIGMPQPVASAVQAVVAAFPGSEVVTTPSPAPAAQVAPAAAPAAAPSGMMRIKKQHMDLPQVDWLPAQCSKCGGTEVWDNRKDHPDFGGSRSDKSPYFKCANRECGAGFWKPKS